MLGSATMRNDISLVTNVSVTSSDNMSSHFIIGVFIDVLSDILGTILYIM